MNRIPESIGIVLEGTLEGGGFYIRTDEGLVSVTSLLRERDGRRVRLVLANLDILDGLVRLGCTAGNEQAFVDSLSDTDLKRLLGPK